MALTWNDLFLSGSVVDLDTSRWGARVHITPADLGIADTDAVDQALALGSHRLVPRDAFEAIDEIAAKAKRAVEHHSMNFGFIRGARYVPGAKLEKLLGVLVEHRAAYAAAVDEFVAAYETTKAAMLPVLRQALGEAAKTAEAAEAALARLADQYPPADDVRARFGIKWNVYALQGPKTKDAAVAAQDETEAVRGVVRGMVEQLRTEVTEKLADVLALIQKGGKLHAKSIGSALAVLDHVDEVNVLGDEVLAEQVRGLRRALAGIEQGQRVPDSAVNSLEGIKRALSADLETAVAAAEAKLTGVGRRRLEVAV